MIINESAEKLCTNALGVALSTPYGVSMFNAIDAYEWAVERAEDALADLTNKRPTKKSERAWGDYKEADGQWTALARAFVGYALMLGGLEPDFYYQMWRVLNDELAEYRSAKNALRYRDPTTKQLRRILRGSNELAFVWC